MCGLEEMEMKEYWYGWVDVGNGLRCKGNHRGGKLEEECMIMSIIGIHIVLVLHPYIGA